MDKEEAIIVASCIVDGDTIYLRPPGERISSGEFRVWLQESANLARYTARVLEESRFKSEHMRLEIAELLGQAKALQEVISYLDIQTQ